MNNIYKLIRYAIVIVLILSIAHITLAEEDGKKNFLWEIESKNNIVYLLGSLHLFKEEDYPLDPEIERAFDNSQVLVFEIDPDSVSAPEVQNLMLKKSIYENGKTLKENISPETYNSISEKIKELGLEIQNFNNFKPWFVSITLALLKLQNLGFDPNRGIDRHFFNKAKKDKKETKSLETVEFQLNLFADLSPKIQEEMLQQTLKDLDIIEEHMNDIVGYWKNGNTKNLKEIIFESLDDYPELYAKIFKERNHDWLKQIEPFLNENQNYMVVVGSGHLLGKDGLINLLEEKGYKVKQL